MTLALSLVLVLLVAHFVGDFICQSDWMATNKSKRWDALFLHVSVYSLVLALFVAVASGSTGPNLTFWAANFAAHFVQDAITSRINARLWFIDGVRSVPLRQDAVAGVTLTPTLYEVAYNDKRHWFFVAIGFDQLLHYVTLCVTAAWWLQ